jgi:hypothetical protein
MAAVFPEEKPAFFSMITGSVNELYAFRHHFKWWKEMRGSSVQPVHDPNHPHEPGDGKESLRNEAVK